MIKRTPTRAEGGITPEEKAKMDLITQKWIKIAFQTGRTDKNKLTEAIKRLYKVSGLKEPRVVIVPSPLVMAQAYGLSAGIWHLRKNKNIADVGSATSSATDSATALATYSATDSATHLATDSSTALATASATDSATDSAKHLATDLATLSATRLATQSISLIEIAKYFVEDKHASFLLSCIDKWKKVYQGGNMWAGFPAYAEACRDVLGLTGLDCWDKWQAWEDCAKLGGFRVMHEEFCIVSDFPDTLKVNTQNQAHSDTGPSHRWTDGFEIYHLNGVKFEKELWQKIVNRTLTEKELFEITDVDQRTQAMKYMGHDFLIKQTKAQLLDDYSKYIVCTDNGYVLADKNNPLAEEVNYKLYKIPKGNIFTQDAYYALFDCPSTRKKHFEGVEVSKTVPEAFAWRMSSPELGIHVTPEDWIKLVPLEDEN